MTDVISLFWPPAGWPPETDAGGFDPDALLAALSEETGLEITRARPESADPEAADWPEQDPRQRFLAVHLTFPQTAMLAYDATTDRTDSAADFARFASAIFGDFQRFRRRWVASDFARGQAVFNLSRLRHDAEGEIAQLFRTLIGTDPAPETVARIEALCRPLLDHLEVTGFRHHDDALFAQLRELRLPRETVTDTFRELMEREIGESHVLHFQTLPSVVRLRNALMTSQEYLSRKGLSAAEIRAGYRLFLDREPSESELERARGSHPDLASLRKVFLQSSEFSRLYARTAGAGNSFMAGMAGAQAHGGKGGLAQPNLKPRNSDRVVFLHMPKCGGTTLHNILAQWFGPENMHVERFNGLYGYTAAHLASSLVFSGHYDFYATTLIPGPKKMISFLRDPLDRLVSLYNFHRAHTPAIIERNNLQLPRWANEHDIDAYFAHEKIRAHPAVNNSIVRYFSDVPQIAAARTDPALQEVSMDEMLDQALRNLETFAFVGFMDQYTADMDRLADTLGQMRPKELRKHQVLDDLMESNPDMRKIEKQKPSAETRAAMEDLISYDRIFYAEARRLFAG